MDYNLNTGYSNDGRTSTTQSASRRVNSYQLRTRELELSESDAPVYMGIVNVTPDSFPDGGKYFRPDFNPTAAVDAALRLEDEGARIIDLGAESTRPGAVPVSLEDELRRLEPVLERLEGRLEAPLSVDTYKSQTAESALQRGVEIINDVTGGTDPAMREVWAKYQPGVVVMHHKPGLLGAFDPGASNSNGQRETPDKPETASKELVAPDSFYKDVIEEVYLELERRLNLVLESGLPKEKIALDVGIGFGKTFRDNWALVENIREFHNLGCPLVVGVSRKRFLNFSDDKTSEVGSRLVDQGVQILRVHKIPARR